jgi:hypothetical protein
MKKTAISAFAAAILMGAFTTSVSAEDANVSSVTPKVIFSDDGGDENWSIKTNSDSTDSYFNIENKAQSTPIMTAYPSGDVYFGGQQTAIKKDGSIQIVSSDASNGKVAILLDLNNSSTSGKHEDVGMKFKNSKSNETWVLRTFEKDKGFAISKAGSGVKDFLVTVDGNRGNDYPDDGNPGNYEMKLILGNNAWCDGTWYDASSREYKKDIKPLSEKDALDAFDRLKPVTFVYKQNPSDPKVGFIAEDMPELVSVPKKNAVAAIEIVSVVTKVVQEQRKEIETLKAKIAKLEKVQEKVARIETLLSNLALKADKTKEKVSALLKK